MIEVNIPYLKAIKKLIEDAFPDSRVDVLAEESIFDRSITIKAVVDNDMVYTTIFPDFIYNEAYVAAVFIAQLKERKADND